jgi:3'(2'), 5'-bisphosphate nucleotidase
MKERPMKQDLVRPAMGIAAAAGRAIMNVYSTEFAVEDKVDSSPLTEADMAAHEIIVSALRRLTPDMPVLSEESSKIPFEERRRWRHYWLIDPLDGTREFVNGNGEFTVNLALIEDHEPVLGVVYVPVTETYYFAAKGHGAFKKLGNNESISIHVRAVAGNHFVVVGSRSHRGDSLDHFLANLGDSELVAIGSSLKICLVAEGRADVYPRLGPTSEWDIGAAHCVVEEAGGFVTNTEMEPILYNAKDSLLNPHFLVFGDSTIDWARYL